MSEYRTLKSYLEEDRDVIVLSLIEGKTPRETVEVLETLFLDASERTYEKAALRCLHMLESAIRDFERSESSESSWDELELGIRTKAEMMMRLWPEVTKRIASRDPEDRCVSVIVEMLTCVVHRWSVTSDDEEAERLMHFILGIDVSSDEKGRFLVVLRDYTSPSTKMSRLLQAFRIVDLAVTGGLTWSSWVQGVCRTISIAIARNASFKQTRIMFGALAERVEHANGETVAY